MSGSANCRQQTYTKSLRLSFGATFITWRRDFFSRLWDERYGRGHSGSSDHPDVIQSLSSVVKMADAEVRAGHVFRPGHPRDYLFDLETSMHGLVWPPHLRKPPFSLT